MVNGASSCKSRAWTWACNMPLQLQKVPAIPRSRLIGKSIAAVAACCLFASSFLADDFDCCDDIKSKYLYHQQYLNNPLGSFCFATKTAIVGSTKRGNKDRKITLKERKRTSTGTRTGTSNHSNNNVGNLLKNYFFSRSLLFPSVLSFPLSSTPSLLYKQKHYPSHSAVSGGFGRNSSSNNNNNFFFFSRGFTTATVTKCSGSNTGTDVESAGDRTLGLGNLKSPLSLEGTISNSCNSTGRSQLRTYTTEADVYFQTHGKIPRPKFMHVSIEQLIKDDRRRSGMGTTSTNFDFCELQDKSRQENDDNSNNNSDSDSGNDNILIIGDVHGCLNELQTLVRRAVIDHNSGQPFKCIVLVGDLCNKGPSSAEVIDFVRRQKFWFTVRGNHDDGALGAALGDVGQRRKKKYAWIFGNGNSEDNGNGNGDQLDGSKDNDKYSGRKVASSTLSDEDVEWMSNIPYTITIPKSFWANSPSASIEMSDKSNIDEDTIIVHAGLIPNTPLEKQDIQAMVTLRYVMEKKAVGNNSNKSYAYFENKTSGGDGGDGGDGGAVQVPQLWAKVWNGPSLVIFGHDAKRGLQIEKYAIGLDTGCTYGKQLSGIILPGKTIVSVDAEKAHCPFTRN